MECPEVHLDYREILRRLVIGDTSFLNDICPEHSEQYHRLGSRREDRQPSPASAPRWP